MPEEPRLDQMTDRPIRSLLHRAARREVTGDRVPRVACLLTDRFHRVSHKYSVVKLAQNVLQL